MPGHPIAVDDTQIAIWTREVMEVCTQLVPFGKKPEHLFDWVSAIISSIRGGVRYALEVPIQHYKTTTTLVTVAWMLSKWPWLNILVMQYSHDKAQSSSRILREYAKALGVEMKSGHDTIAEWRTSQGGGCIIMSVMQSRAGFPHDILLVDDPMDEHSSATKKERDTADSQISLYTMRGASHLDSVLLVASPWTDDDPIPRRRGRGGFKHFCFPAIIDEGAEGERAFAPKVISLEKLKDARAEMEMQDPSLRRWMANFMCNPLPPALGFFVGETELVGEIPADAPRGIGVDCAFTGGAKSDWTGVVSGAVIGGKLAIDFAKRDKVGLLESERLLFSLRQRWPKALFFAQASGPEMGVYNALEEKGLPILVEHARWNKATRAQKASQAWQRGSVLVKFKQPWTAVYLTEMHGFDGTDGNVDDQVDATVALYNGVMTSLLPQPRSLGTSRAGVVIR